MPRVGCFTGLGAVIVFTADDTGDGPTDTAIDAEIATFAAAPKQSVGEVTMEIDSLEAPAVSDPARSFIRMCPADLMSLTPLEVTMYFDPDLDPIQLIGRTGLIVRTHPLHTGQSTAAHWDGDGFVKSATLPEEAANNLSMSTMAFQWYGTAPATETDLSLTASVT